LEYGKKISDLNTLLEVRMKEKDEECVKKMEKSTYRIK
jgi:hypothetical protein